MSDAAVTKKKWERPENWFAAVGVAIAGYFVLQGLDKILPLVNRVLENTLYTMVLGGGILALVTIGLSTDIHQLIFYAYMGIMRKITELFVTIDPISIMKTYVKQLQINLEEIGRALAQLRGQAREVDSLITSNKAEWQRNMEGANKAKSLADEKHPEMKRQMVLQMRQAGRLEESDMTYQDLSNKLKSHIKVTEQMQNLAEFTIQDIQLTVEVEEQKRKTIRSSYNAMASVRRIVKSNKDREMFDLAMEATARDYHQKVGEIEQFMHDSQAVLSNMDIQNGIYEDKAFSKLTEWEKRSNQLVENSPKFRVAEAATLIGVDGETSEVSPMSRLFDK